MKEEGIIIMKPRYKKYIKYIIIILLAGLLCYYYTLAQTRALIHSAFDPGVRDVFESYFKVNKAFPISESDLIDKGYLAKEKDEYYWTKDPNNPKIKKGGLAWFKAFKFKYGFRPEEAELINGKLIDKITGKQVLLISGPNYLDLPEFYESISRKWYLMLKDTNK